MSVEGFNSVEFEPVADSFYGIRVFGVDDGHYHMPHSELWEEPRHPAQIPPHGGLSQGRQVGGLRAMFRSSYLWGPEVNHAMCLVTAPLGSAAERPAFTVQSILHKNGKNMDPDCSCGFWAYTQGTHVMPIRGNMAIGIIQAWGKMIIGPAGFRAEHAKIIGITLNLPFLEPDLEDLPPMPQAGSLAAVARGVAVSIAKRGVVLLQDMFSPSSEKEEQPPPDRKIVTRATVPDALIPHIQHGYPDIAILPDLESLVREFPVSDLSHLLPEEDSTS